MTFGGLGGPAMRAAGAALLDDLTQTAAIGPFDAVRFLGRFLRARRLLEEDLERAPPDLVVLVDFGDFNLPVIAPLVARRGIPILYYISPQIWAWGRWRLRYVRRYVSRMVVLFPFEEVFYRREEIPVTWVGHPLVEHARPSMSKEAARTRFGLNEWRRVVGLLPGSRGREIDRHLPILLAAARRIVWRMPGVQFLLPKAPSVDRAKLEQRIARAGVEVRLAEGPVYDALQLMDAAIVCSGTATLDAALCEVPMAVVYRTSWLTYLAAKSVVRVPRIAMANLVAGRPLVPEFIQHRAAPSRVADAVIGMLRDEERTNEIRVGLRQVRERLGPPGAVDRAASVVLDLLAKKRDAGS